MNLFFPRFQHSILDLLQMEFHFFFLCMKLSRSHDLDHEFNKLAQVDLGCFF